MLRVQLINDFVGTLVIDTDDPIDINAFAQTIKRSTEVEGIIYEVVFDLDFIKGARLYLKRAFEQGGGIDANVLCNVYELNANTKRWNLYAAGAVNFNKYDLGEDRVTVNIEQVGLQRLVVNGMDIDVDLETTVTENGTAIPAQNTQVVPFHSKSILKVSDLRPIDNEEFEQDDAADFTLPDGGFGGLTGEREFIAYGQFSTQVKQFDELEETFEIPFGWTEMDGQLGNGYNPGTNDEYIAFLTATPDPRVEVLEATEGGVGSVNIKLNYVHKVQGVQDAPHGGWVPVGSGVNAGALGNVEIKAWFEWRDAADTIKQLTNIGTWNMAGYGYNERQGVLEEKIYQQNNLAVVIGDKFYVYETVRVWGNYRRPAVTTGDGEINHNFFIQSGGDSFIKITTGTTVPDTNVKAIMIHDAVKRCVQYITNREDCFRSNLLGRTDIDYDVDGLYSLICVTNGNNIRGLADKKIITNLKDLMEFINSVACIGIGFEVDDEGVERIVLEHKDYFYDKTTRVLSLTNVANIHKEVIPDKYYNQIEYGYSNKIDIEQINSIDEFNTIRRSTIPVTNTKNGLKVATKFITGGYVIESQRRLNASTEDGKNDDNMFAAVVIRDGLGYKTKKNEGYDYIDVYSPETTYNADISPARNLRNWFKIISSSLVYSIREKIVKFSYGEVNYTMTSKKPGELVVAENGNVDIANVVPIWDNMRYPFEHPLSSEEFRLLKTNPYGYIEFFDLHGEQMEGFIESVEHDTNKGVAAFKLLKVAR